VENRKLSNLDSVLQAMIDTLNKAQQTPKAVETS
jgi:hypothetical protein